MASKVVSIAFDGGATFNVYCKLTIYFNSLNNKFN